VVLAGKRQTIWGQKNERPAWVTSGNEIKEKVTYSQWPITVDYTQHSLPMKMNRYRPPENRDQKDEDGHIHRPR